MGGTIFVVALVAAVLLAEIGASEAARGLGLALFFLVWPLLFLAIAPPAKPGLDPVTAKYYLKPGTERAKSSSTGDSNSAGPINPAGP